MTDQTAVQQLQAIVGCPHVWERAAHKMGDVTVTAFCQACASYCCNNDTPPAPAPDVSTLEGVLDAVHSELIDSGYWVKVSTNKIAWLIHKDSKPGSSAFFCAGTWPELIEQIAAWVMEYREQ